MKMVQQLRYVSLILIWIVSLFACKEKAAEEHGSGPAASSSMVSGKAGWLVNLNDAQARSVKEHKPILVYFTASDTCGLCKHMDTNVFSTPTFSEWAEKSVVLLKVDFSNLPEGSREQSTGMAQSLKVNTYPTFWILNIMHEPENNRFKVKPIGMIGYQETPEKFMGNLQGLIRSR